MAIELITGVPGNGKTLFTLAEVVKRSKDENRCVYYHGILDLRLPDWILMDDPRQWHTLPPGAIVVIDEAQETFRARTLGSVPPEFVTKLEKHRHSGYDIYMLTQHPSLIDSHVRRLVQRHRHLVRIFGMEASNVHEWNKVKDTCEKSRADADTKKWGFDKSLYGIYKSAEVHTMKARIPRKVYVLIACVLALIACLVALAMSISSYFETGEPGTSAAPKTSASAPSFGPSAQTVMPPGQLSHDPLQDAKHFVAQNTPRVEGLPHTAPKYDQMTRPDTVPVPAMCIRRGSRCQCYTQQATKMDVGFNQCVDIAYNGYFQEFDPTPNRRESPPSPAASSSGPAHEGGSSDGAILALNTPVPDVPPVANDQPEPRGFRRAVVGSVR